MNSFVKNHIEKMTQIAEECRSSLLNKVAPFWAARVVDQNNGGYLTSFDLKGHLYDSNKPGWFLGRIIYMFSSLIQEYGNNPKWLAVAKAGYDFLDRAHVGDGRFAQAFAPDGSVKTGAISIFTDHFVVKGLINYLYALGSEAMPWEIYRAGWLLEQLMKHVNQPEILYLECSDERFQKHAVNFMTLAVLIESRKLFGSNYDQELRKCIFRSLHQFANDDLHAPMEYIAKDGSPLPVGLGRLVDAGHTMESLWFSMEAAELLGEPNWNIRAAEVLNWVLDLCWDDKYGGFMQHVDYEKIIPEEAYLITNYNGINVAWDDKIWWVQAEGLIALCMSAINNQNEAHWEKFIELYDYVQKMFVEPNTGEWYSFLHRDGSMICNHLGSMLKGPYHVPRCLMILSKVLTQALEG